MIITKDLSSLDDFEAWSGAVDTKYEILNQGYDEEFIHLMEELYPEGLDEGALNDILWFDDKWIYETLGMRDPYSDDEDEEEEYEEDEEDEENEE